MKKVKLPKVSIITITYNQEAFIAQALDSFLNQKTKFPIEIIVSDDASTDRTPKIIAKYAKKYPELFRVTLRKENVGPTANFYGALSQASGTYVALCEGDDYWTDPQKLRRQISFLDKHKDYTLCFHPVRVFFEDNSQPERIFPNPESQPIFDIDRLIEANFIQTNSVVYRRQSYENLNWNVAPVDWYMHLYHAQFGKIGFINRVMSAYRRHDKGIWWKVSKDIKEMWRKTGASHLKLFSEVIRMYPDKKLIVYPNVFRVFRESAAVSVSLLKKLIKEFPDFCAEFVAQNVKYQKDGEKRISHLSNVALDKDREINSLRQAIVIKEVDIVRLQRSEQELLAIKNSRSWKLIRLARRVLTRGRNG
ncbi:MAG: glycosyltransferase [Patescibacteria group bacterium]